MNPYNISARYLRPGFAYGGSCLPKDVAAVCNTARELGSPMEILEALHSANIRHRTNGILSDPYFVGKLG